MRKLVLVLGAALVCIGCNKQPENAGSPGKSHNEGKGTDKGEPVLGNRARGSSGSQRSGADSVSPQPPTPEDARQRGLDPSTATQTSAPPQKASGTGRETR